MKTKLTIITLGLPAAIAAMFAANVMAAASGPVMRLFPTTVLEDIKETGAVAEEMENSLQDVIARLDLQQQLYTESRCADADEDPGCGRIAKQLGATYLEMLSNMTERLPAMETAVNNTRTGLEKRLREELGQKSTPSDLQNTLLGRVSQAENDQPAIALRGRSGIRLSDRFKQYYDLVATRRSGSSQSLAVIASDIYLDMEEASQMIAATREEITRAELMEQLNQSFGHITPEMTQVVNGVKSILFGESALMSPIAAAPMPQTDAPFVSPLEI
ncbi:MAG: hypothetical protein ABGY96_05880 [bacterium]|nr:hypothetical protein [Gammaproteobacteria bacterium]